MDYDRTLAALHDWGDASDNVRALVLTGSGASGAPHPLSDRDVEVHAVDIDALLDDESWWRCLGDVLVVERLHNSDGDPTRLVHYVGGKLDFTLLAAGRLPGRTYRRPIRVLLDKDGLSSVSHVVGQSRATPGEQEFATVLNEAYAAALMCARAIARGELWSIKIRDRDLKSRLLQMIEWDHLARHGSDYDTRFHGSGMTQWMDEDVREPLMECWGRFDAVDSAKALRNSVRLFARLTKRTAKTWEFTTFDHGKLSAEIESLLRT